MIVKRNKSQIILLLTLVFAGCCFTIGASYPGFMSPDSIDQYIQAKNNVYTNWHPPIMSWIWNKLLWINDGPQPILFLNNIMYWLAIFLVAIRLKQFVLSLIFILVSTIFPPLIDFIGVIWKDTLLFSTLCLQCSLIFYFQDIKLNHFKKAFLFLALFTLSFFAIATRHNAAAALVPLIGILISLFIKPINIWSSWLIGFALTLILFKFSKDFNRHICQEKTSHPEQQLMFYDLLAISVATNQHLLPVYLKHKINQDTIQNIYSPCDGAMYPFFGLNCHARSEQQYDSLKTLWKKEVFKNPVIFLNHKFSSFYCFQTNSGLKTFAMIMPNDRGLHLSDKNIFRKYFIKLTNNNFADKLYSGWIYLLGCFTIFITSLLHYVKVKHKQLRLICSFSLSGLLYSLSYILLSPCNDFRYHYWTIGAMYISFVLYTDLISSKKK